MAIVKWRVEWQDHPDDGPLAHKVATSYGDRDSPEWGNFLEALDSLMRENFPKSPERVTSWGKGTVDA